MDCMMARPLCSGGEASICWGCRESSRRTAVSLLKPSNEATSAAALTS